MPLRLDGTYGVSGVVGTASSAAVYGADVDSGIVFSGNQTLINSDGSTIATVGASGINVTGIVTATSSVRIGTGVSISSPAINVLTLGTNNVERVRVDSGGRLGIGTNIYPNNEMLVVDNVNGSNAYNSKFVFSGTTNTAYCASTWTHGQSGTAVGYAGVGGSNTGNVSFRNTFVVGTQNANDLVLNTNDTERVRIDSSGRVTMPYQPAFLAFFTSNTDVTTSANTVFAFDKVDFNVGGHFNTSTNRFTCPVAGIYAFSWVFFFTNSASNTQGMNVAFLVNGSQYSPSDGVTTSDALQVSTIPNGAGGYLSNSATYYIQLSANDYVQLYARGANVRLYQGHSHFSGTLLA